MISEGKDIFGFERHRQEEEIDRQKRLSSLKQLNSELLIKELWRPVGLKRPSSNFSDEITWGQVNLGEAIRLDISPFGSLKIITRRIVNDLEGNKTWICKDAIPLPDGHYDGEETVLAMEVFDKVNEINKSPIDSPKKDYNLEHLALKLAGKIKVERPVKIMIFDRIKKLNENHYIVAMNFSGHGLEAPTQRRMEQFHIHLFFDPSRGLVRSYGTGIESPTKVHKWEAQVSEFDEHFAPTQSTEEIITNLLNILRTY
ncbi:MAG: hypothetical protein DWQ19_11210 [Crenarchaeota archaeon]|nr:MAG: hypothetical protein DWQ19_11210 [Thermoproteota archaeon]